MSKKTSQFDFTIPNENEQKFDNGAERLKSLAHPKRLEILAALVKCGNSNVTDLQKIIKLPQPTLSQHLARMQRSGILNRSKRGTEVFYNIHDPATVEGIKLLTSVDFHVIKSEKYEKKED